MGKNTIIDVWKNYLPNKTKKELQDLWESIHKEFIDKGMTEIQADSMTNQEFGKQLRREKFSKNKREIVSFLGVIMGTTRCNDSYEYMRGEAKKEFNADPQMAVLKGLTDEKGVALDPRETIFGTQTNKNFHKPLIGNSYYRTVLGLCKKSEETDEPKVWKMRLNGKAAKEFRFKPYIPVLFKAVLRDDKKGFYDLGVSKQTAFAVTKGAQIDIEDWIRKYQLIYNLDEMAKAHANSVKASDFWVFIEAYVDRIDTTPNAKTGSRTIFLSDPERTPNTVRVFLEPNVPITFGEYSKVIVVGKTKEWKRNDGTTDISLVGYAVFPLEGLTLSPEEEPEITGEGEEDQGYIIPFLEDDTAVEIDKPTVISEVESPASLKGLENGEEEEE